MVSEIMPGVTIYKESALKLVLSLWPLGLFIYLFILLTERILNIAKLLLFSQLVYSPLETFLSSRKNWNHLKTERTALGTV